MVAEASTQLVYVAGNRLRRPEDADRWLRHARAAIDRLPSPRDAETSLESILGNYHHARGELPTAREHLERALAAREQQLGPLHPQTLVVRSNLALVHDQQGDHARARALLEQVLADRIEVLGPEHPEVAATYANLAVME